jgi:NADPH:quinone reductase-like Zn-dependent oxidoreductase
MKAIRVHDFKERDNLRFEHAPIPEPKLGEVLVRIRAASVNPVDLKLAEDALHGFVTVDLPWIPGGDFSGVIASFGPGINDFAIGDAVFGSRPTGTPGTYSEYVAAPASTIAMKPQKLSHVEAASVPIAAQTAWQGLFEHGSLQRGQTVLIHGGSGGVGSFAVQLARWRGAIVLATASKRNLDY